MPLNKNKLYYQSQPSRQSQRHKLTAKKSNYGHVTNHKLSLKTYLYMPQTQNVHKK